MMKLSALLSNADVLDVAGSLELDISAVCYDSRKAQPGSLFVALKGGTVNGSLFIAQAIEKGAVAVVTEEPEPQPRATIVVVKDARLALGDLAATDAGDRACASRRPSPQRPGGPRAVRMEW